MSFLEYGSIFMKLSLLSKMIKNDGFGHFRLLGIVCRLNMGFSYMAKHGIEVLWLMKPILKARSRLYLYG